MKKLSAQCANYGEYGYLCLFYCHLIVETHNKDKICQRSISQSYSVLSDYKRNYKKSNANMQKCCDKVI